MPSLPLLTPSRLVDLFDELDLIALDQRISLLERRILALERVVRITPAGVTIATPGDLRISAGANLAVTVGIQHTLAVGRGATWSVGQALAVQVGRQLDVTVQEGAQLVTGAAGLNFRKDGTVLLRGKDVDVVGTGEITVRASADLVLKGAQILQN